MKTPKELAQATADAALESLQAALKKEVELRDALRKARLEEPHWIGKLIVLGEQVRDAEKESDHAFKAWREAQQAVPTQ